jgi:hypothetical protein
LTLSTSWFVDAPAIALRYFEHRRATSMARLATVTRQLREEMDVHAAAARATMAEAAWAEAGWVEVRRPEVIRTEAA